MPPSPRTLGTFAAERHFPIRLFSSSPQPPIGAGVISALLPASTSIPADWRDLLALTKPRVMTLVVFTGLAGLLAAPVSVNPVLGFAAVLCIALGAGAAGALNQWYEADLDAKMKRTASRPLPAGRMTRQTALHFGVGLAAFSVILMDLAANHLAAAILAVSILFYVLVYTVWLKRRTAQNIVIGGAAGAFPPLIGWVAATGDISALPVLLFAIIFLWTPPHFWALSLFIKTDYAAAGVPMLPVVAGVTTTRRQIWLYTIPMIPAAVAPWAMGLTGWVYGAASIALNAVFLLFALAVLANKATEPAAMKPEKRLFAFSILYLFALFGALVVDRWVIG
ncbi:MAG: protoheme IX farnesyltransferase [Sphingomonas sp.]|nr:protoheme IX farnesyltransferase [Sphingomonas sp.]